MAVLSRVNAVQGEYVRLYCTFERDGNLSDPVIPVTVTIVSKNYYSESSSTSSSTDYSSSSQTESSSSTWQDNTTSFGPLLAKREAQGIWYVDWFVPFSLPVGSYYDIWTFKWDSNTPVEAVFEFDVHPAGQVNFWSSPAIVNQISDNVLAMIRDLSNDFIYEAQHIPVYWEQAYRTEDVDTVTTAYGNWNRDFKPLVRKNNRLVTDWVVDYNGRIRFNSSLDPEDTVYVTYKFAYFSSEEMLDFLMAGLYAMNGTPPASETYMGLGGMPFVWVYGVLLYAAMTAFQRLVFGLAWQERAIIYGETPELQQRAMDNIAKIYADYNETWKEWAKNIKSRKLPGISMIVTPEYTLPGGRSRWFRYMYK